MKLIGFTGEAGAGKDTAAAGLIADKEYIKIPFADPIKQGINAMTGWDMSQWSDREWKEAIDPELGISPRHMAQTLGTQWGRNLINEDLWVKLTLRKAEGKNVVITDVRFDNEAIAIKEAGGYIIKVHRPNNPFCIGTEHESEKGVSPEYVDAYVYNIGSASNLISRVDDIESTLYSEKIES